MRARIRLGSLLRLLGMLMMSTVTVSVVVTVLGAVTVSVSMRHMAVGVEQMRVMAANMQQVSRRQQQLQQGNTQSEGRSNGSHFEGYFEGKQFPSPTSCNSLRSEIRIC